MIATLLEQGAPLALDAMDPDARRAAVLGLTRRQQRALYERAAEAPPLQLEDLVPSTAEDLEPVAHAGFNTLPLPAFGKRFTKWMARSQGQIIGYNASVFRLLIGPGYFVVRETEAEHRERGALVVDYYQVPRGGWPGPGCPLGPEGPGTVAADGAGAGLWPSPTGGAVGVLSACATSAFTRPSG